MKRVQVVAAVVGLVALVAIANYAFNMDPTQLAARGVGRDPHDHGHDEEAEEHAHEPEPAAPTCQPVGPEGAPVLIEVYHSKTGEACGEMWSAVTAAAQPYSPHVRVELRDLDDAAVLQRAQRSPLKGGRGLAVNGKVIVDVPGLGNFGMVALVGGPQDRNWNQDVVRQVIEHELRAKGVPFTPPPAQAAPAATHEHSHDHEHGQGGAAHDQDHG